MIIKTMSRGHSFDKWISREGLEQKTTTVYTKNDKYMYMYKYKFTTV